MDNKVWSTLSSIGTEALTTAVGACGSRLETAALRPRGPRAAPPIGRWFLAYKPVTPFPELPGLPDELALQLAGLLSGDVVQGGLQELLAVRLTDAAETHAAHARGILARALGAENPVRSPAASLAAYYDEEICALVARLEAAEPALLTQIRSGAVSARMTAIVRALPRHFGAASGRPDPAAEASFLMRYRRHVLDRHGRLEPPDFERRRLVPIGDIYVSPVIREEIHAERVRLSPGQGPPSLTVWELADRLDRTVLLADPGGGKTTASTVLMHHFAYAARKTPFLVTLRDFASEDPPRRSVAGFIEHQLETLYQCPAPPGLVDLLLLAGRAVVIFDGLDELLDTSRRADVTARVEHFCAEYPLAPVLVTSRLVGYDQARLDETQFVGYRLGGFRDEDVENFARSWFDLQEDARPGDADAFLAESQIVPDLRTNPLMLSLLCILYRGAGSLPRNRADICAQCANLLFRRWDERRNIHQKLRAGHLIEPILRLLAWELLTLDGSGPVAAERELVEMTTEILQDRGFESQDDARDAAREFIEFCRGRLWVFSDVGTTAAGESLYGFTHRTFLDYFAASRRLYPFRRPPEHRPARFPRPARRTGSAGPLSSRARP